MGPEWIWVIVIVAVLFGASRLPLLGRNVGVGIKEFKKGVAESREDKENKSKSEAGKPASGSPSGSGDERGASA